MDLSKLDKEKINSTKREKKLEKEKAYKEEAGKIASQLDEKANRLFLAAQEKGASSWLSALPLKKLGYSLTSQQFRNTLCVRYGWNISGLPNFCACGKKNNIDHILICKKGGYVTMRHNILRNTEAKLLEEVCKDVRLEPELIPTQLELQGTAADRARPDISARGVWNPHERTFFDVIVTHPNADYNMNKSLESIYAMREAQKKNKYNDRIINVEKSTFTPLVFTTTGGMGPECERFNRRLAEQISSKRNEKYCHVMAYIRTRLRFALLKAIVIAIHGYRGTPGQETDDETPIADISFNLIPEAADKD